MEYFMMVISSSIIRSLFFFNDTATTEIYPLSLHDASSDLSPLAASHSRRACPNPLALEASSRPSGEKATRSEEHTSELQSPDHLVCRLLLEKKKMNLYGGVCVRSSSAEAFLCLDVSLHREF